MIKRTDIFISDSLEDLLTTQDNLEYYLANWESVHNEYYHTSEITFTEKEYNLKIEVYAVTEHENYN